MQNYKQIKVKKDSNERKLFQILQEKVKTKDNERSVEENQRVFSVLGMKVKKWYKGQQKATTE